MNIKALSISLIMSGLLLTLIETAYFGWHFSPHSGLEMLCDLISILPTVAGISLLVGSKKE